VRPQARAASARPWQPSRSPGAGGAPACRTVWRAFSLCCCLPNSCGWLRPSESNASPTQSCSLQSKTQGAVARVRPEARVARAQTEGGAREARDPRSVRPWQRPTSRSGARPSGPAACSRPSGPQKLSGSSGRYVESLPWSDAESAVSSEPEPASEAPQARHSAALRRRRARASCGRAGQPGSHRSSPASRGPRVGAGTTCTRSTNTDAGSSTLAAVSKTRGARPPLGRSSTSFLFLFCSYFFFLFLFFPFSLFPFSPLLFFFLSFSRSSTSAKRTSKLHSRTAPRM